ncbi:hypothetical protein QYE76_049178 [Lolium multiflorum]|uniref:RNase H type-1 domain-containing protein n=1 Tax=Lolium multiflorum TaxID=4521 RepID=A0AAD8SNT9_LOLMU|nr:hypothetical protein QYE76_049178 [Lolium multiflorum]
MDVRGRSERRRRCPGRCQIWPDRPCRRTIRSEARSDRIQRRARPVQTGRGACAIRALSSKPGRFAGHHPVPVHWKEDVVRQTFSPVTGRGGWGAVARDNDGDLVVAQSGLIPVAIDALHTETVAVLKAIAMAERLGSKGDCNGLSESAKGPYIN